MSAVAMAAARTAKAALGRLLFVVVALLAADYALTAGPAAAEVGPVTADAGGPYTVLEGGSLTLDASGSGAGSLTYSWDLNGDGVFGDAHGATPTLGWAQLAGLSINDGPAMFHPSVRVDDGRPADAVVSAATSLTVVDAAPVAFVGGAAAAAGGLRVVFLLSSTDPSGVDQAAGFTYTVYWGDGTGEAPFHASGALRLPHVYPAPGSYTVTLTTRDKDGLASAPATRTVIVVRLVPGGCGTPGRTLLVVGTAAADVISITAAGAGTVSVQVDGVATDVATDAYTSVVVLARGGDDVVDLTGLASVPRIVDGGAGDDRIIGGDGPSVLIGGPGDDALSGGSARDILIGGAGADTLSGNGGDDILIPGALTLDPATRAGRRSLCGLQSEWLRAGTSFAVRSRHLLGMDSDARGGPHFVLSGPRRNVGPRNHGDVTHGGGGQNWCLTAARAQPPPAVTGAPLLHRCQRPAAMCT